MPHNYYTRLLQFAQQFQKYYDRQFLPLLERTGLTMRDVRVLLFLINNPDYDTAKDITALRGLSKSQVSQAVDLLVAEGMLRRTPDQADRRVIHLSITAQGEPLARECQIIQDRCSQKLLVGLTPEQQEQFRAYLRTVLDNGIREGAFQ